MSQELEKQLTKPGAKVTSKLKVTAVYLAVLGRPHNVRMMVCALVMLARTSGALG